MIIHMAKIVGFMTTEGTLHSSTTSIISGRRLQGAAITRKNMHVVGGTAHVWIQG